MRSSMGALMSEDLTERVNTYLNNAAEPKRLDTVARDLYDGAVECPCCDRPHDAFAEFRGEVSEVLRTLLDRNRVACNAEWEYAVVRR